MNTPMRDKHLLSDGSSVWIQRTKIPGVRRPFWTVVQCDRQGYEAPIITSCRDINGALDRLAQILKDDVLCD